MPTPTCASCIIGTSLAPSPIESVTGVGEMPVRTSRTIHAFCNGETRQAMTTLQRVATSKKGPPKPNSDTCSSELPVTIRATSLPSEIAPSAIAAIPTSSALSSSASTAAVPPPAPEPMSRIMTSISSLRTFVLYPIFLAVSNLSPVSTQSFTPAPRRRTMVSATPTCSLSSMPVAPKISSCASKRSAAADRRASRSCIALCALSYSACQSANSAASILRRPSTRVRNPS
mmetsp:Transcript_78837/g.198079  ORF Transcript_78837/g.198079 Transcript_78837/m.198079 type:complete len:230 (+) Transcript_78837:2284-2973(+)